MLEHNIYEKALCRIFWYILVGFWWLWECYFFAKLPESGIGFIGVSFAFGMTVLTMAYALGHISGAHFNPAVSFGLWAAGRFNPKNLFGYIVSQTLGALVAASVLFLILTGKSDFESIGTFAANGYGDLSPGGYSLSSVLISEFVLTAFFLIIILGSTTEKLTRSLRQWPLVLLLPLFI